MVEDGPVGPHQLVVLGTFFMLREVEAPLLLVANVKLDAFNQTVTFKLPSSKTDPGAASVQRSWGCLCNTHQEVGCPYHQASRRYQCLMRKFNQDELIDMPFFPTSAGDTVEKAKVVGTLEHLHQ